MEIRPGLKWNPIHPHYAAGIAAIMTPFILYPARESAGKSKFALILVRVFAVPGLGVSLFAIFMATSRGVILAIAVLGGLWMVWWLITKKERGFRLRRNVLFPALVVTSLFFVIVFLYAGPANFGGSISSDYKYGTGSRGELSSRSLYLVSDFPFTGGGLNAFSGLHSYYMLSIPFFNVVNSHNLFLDVAIEQGLLGGLSFLMIYFISIWFAARAVAQKDSQPAQMLCWLFFVGLILAFVHGMVDDYLYNGNGSLLSLALAGPTTPMQPESGRMVKRTDYRASSLVALAAISIFIMNLNTIRSAWYANLGAV